MYTKTWQAVHGGADWDLLAFFENEISSCVYFRSVTLVVLMIENTSRSNSSQQVAKFLLFKEAASNQSCSNQTIWKLQAMTDFFFAGGGGGEGGVNKNISSGEGTEFRDLISISS